MPVFVRKINKRTIFGIYFGMKTDKKTDKKNLNVHFIGVGGVSMSSLARYLLSVGFNVSGSDIAPGENLEKLAEEGVTIYIGQSAENVDGKDVVVYATR